MIAQALLEKSLLDTAVAGMSSAFDSVETVFLERPWVVVAVVALVVGFLMFGRRN
jgi:hypothetical protein